ncbi:MAG: MCE family protein [Rhodothermales bacterium]|nr:MCE family protein [Rhodothermales bacterium]
MKYQNELKVGISIIIAVVIMILGIRYFKDIPLFGGTLEYTTITDNAKGLISGNEVRTSGIKIGSINRVSYRQEDGTIEVSFRVDSKMQIPRGTVAEINGIDALTGIKLELTLGDASGEAYPPGSVIPYATGGTDLLGDLSTRAPELVDRMDSVLGGLDATLGATETLLTDGNSDLRGALYSMRQSTAALNSLIREEHGKISSVLENVDSLTTSLAGISANNADSIKATIENLAAAARSMESSMNSLEATTVRLESVLVKIDSGQGTFGMLVNDPGLYQNLDSVTASLNDLLKDLKKNPRRYLKDMSVVEIF